jgi:hypothetical protein
MVYMLKFDIAHSSTVYHKKDFNVRESPTGQVGLILRLSVGRVICNGR